MNIVEWIIVLIGLPIIMLMAWGVDRKDDEDLGD